MEEFTTSQFLEMPRPARTSLITNCINMIHDNIPINIDGNEINEVSDFVSWLMDTLV
jgi:hypothetical protein